MPDVLDKTAFAFSFVW